MPTKDDRKAFEQAIKNKNQDQIRAFLQRDDAKELLLMEDKDGHLPIHEVCYFGLDKASLQLILDAGVQHGIAKQMLEAKNKEGATCLHIACAKNLSIDSLRLLLEYLSQYTDIKKMLEEKNKRGSPCLHLACSNKMSPDSLRLLLEHMLKHMPTSRGCLKPRANMVRLVFTLHVTTTCPPDSLHLLLEYLSKHADIKKMLEEKNNNGWTCVHAVCGSNSSPNSLRLLLEYLSEFADIKNVLEAKDKYGSTCLHSACGNKLSADSFRPLLEYLSKHADIKKMLEEKDTGGCTCLHLACRWNLRADSLRLLVSFFPSKDSYRRVLDTKDNLYDTPIYYAKEIETQQLVRDPDSVEKCRRWLLRKHEHTFLCSLFPNSFDQTCQALKELPKNALEHSQQHATIMLISLMTSPSKFRQAIDETTTSAPMSRYFDVVKKGDKKNSDYSHWRKNIHWFREFYGQWPPGDRRTASTFEVEGSCSCSIQ